MKKIYAIDYDWKFKLTVEIDHDVITDEKLHEINCFWSGSKSRVSEEDGSILNAVLKNLANVVLVISFERELEVQQVIHLFDWNANQGIEGWPSMGGEYGIKILKVEPFDEIDASDMTVTELLNQTETESK